MEILLVVLLIVISVASKSRKNSQAAVRAHQRTAAARPAPASKPQPAAVASPKQMQPKAEQLKMVFYKLLASEREAQQKAYL